MFFEEAIKGGFDLFRVTGFFFFKEVIDDEPFVGFTEPEVVSKFNFSSAFPSFEDLHIGVIEAEDFFRVGELATSDHSFVSLFDSSGEVVEDALDTLRDLPDLTFAEFSFGAMEGEKFEMVPGVFGNSFREFFHVTENDFSMFATVFGAEFSSHFHAVGVDVA